MSSRQLSELGLANKYRAIFFTGFHTVNDQPQAAERYGRLGAAAGQQPAGPCGFARASCLPAALPAAAAERKVPACVRLPPASSVACRNHRTL